MKESFPALARVALRDTQLRRNLRKATTTIREKTARVSAELPDWEALRDRGQAIKQAAMAGLDQHLLALENSVTARGGTVHWARDAAEARSIIAGLVRATGSRAVVKVKSMTTDEIGLNPALEALGITPIETDLAELIVQMAHDRPSHILVPAIHKNRAEIRTLFMQQMQLDQLDDTPEALTEAARRYLRARFLQTPVAISGANFAIAETGTVGVVESEGNGRMCLTLPHTLITLMGIEKVLPRWNDLAVFLQLLPRAATGERMNPYTTLWSGVRENDGPAAFHLVLLDGGRTDVLADPVTRETLHCIRCSRCLNVCPVYERAGGHSYDNSPYQGPIGAILTPQLRGLDRDGSLPFASTLCGACKEVCPVKIDIPRILVELRGQVVRRRAAQPLGRFGAEALAMGAALRMFENPALLALAQRGAHLAGRALGRDGRINWLPFGLGGWTASRDMPAPPAESFRSWWTREGHDDHGT